MITVLPKENYKQIASKMFYKMPMHQAVVIRGWVVDPDLNLYVAKGLMVIGEIARLDKQENIDVTVKGKKLRRREELPNTVGDKIGHKTWRWKQMSEDTYLIWRIQ